MKLCEIMKTFFRRINREIYSLNDVFGCPETPPQECPTFLERSVHRTFRNALASQNIIVIYGESRQGKTWTIDKYCPNQIRIGCTATMNIEQIKKEMLHAVGIDIYNIEHSITEHNIVGVGASTEVGNGLLASAGFKADTSEEHSETIKTEYSSVNLELNTEFVATLKDKSNGSFFVFDNFHYLSPEVQQQFCSLLKEFNYQNIKVIIVGVWKDSSKITALAPDLVNRCEHIDIGSWKEEELTKVVSLGEAALNIRIDEEAKQLFLRCCANNIGIFKSFLLKYCQNFEVFETDKKRKNLSGSIELNEVTQNVINEALAPLRDRILNLALPQREKKKSKRMRQKIVTAILELIIENDAKTAQNGFTLQQILSKVEKICKENGADVIGSSNIIQELGVLHLREENRQTVQNFIPLFFYDKNNRRLLIIEPSIYEIREYNSNLLQEIIDELNTQEESNELGQLQFADV